MGILDRINRLVRANVNDLIDRSDVPEQALDHSIHDMESSLGQARAQVRVSAREEEKIISELRAARERAVDWEDRAMLALRADNEELAREALVEKNRMDRRADQLREELARHREYIADLTRSLDALEHKLDSARSRRRSMAPRRREDGARRPGGGSPEGGYTFPRFDDEGSGPSGGGGSWDRDDYRAQRGRGEGRRGASSAEGSNPRRAFAFDDDLRREYPEDVFGVQRPFEAFDAMEDKMEGAQARLDAERELLGGYDDPLRDDLGDRFRKLENERGGAQRVADLKRRMNDGDVGSSSADDVRRRLLEDLEG